MVATPRPFVDEQANENYWTVRRKNLTTLNPYQSDRVRWMGARMHAKGTTLLDIGSGNGEMLLAFRDMGLDVTASDFSPIARQRLRAHGFDALDLDLSRAELIERMPTYDFITLCEVLEHLQDPEHALLSLLAKAKVAVYFSVPNTGYYAYRLRLLGGRFPVQWRAHPGEHVRFWTLADMKWWLRSLGLEQQATVRPYQGWPVLGHLAPGLFRDALMVEIRTGGEVRAAETPPERFDGDR